MTKKTNTREEIRKILSKVYTAGGNEIKVIHEADIPELVALIEKEKKEDRERIKVMVEQFRDFPIKSKVKAKGLSQGEKEAYTTGFNRMLETTLELLDELEEKDGN